MADNELDALEKQYNDKINAVLDKAKAAKDKVEIFDIKMEYIAIHEDIEYKGKEFAARFQKIFDRANGIFDAKINGMVAEEIRKRKERGIGKK